LAKRKWINISAKHWQLIFISSSLDRKHNTNTYIYSTLSYRAHTRPISEFHIHSQFCPPIK
jgi:hypothetical protein